MAIAEFKVTHTNDKEYRIEGRFADGRTFEMQPIGHISAGEVKSLCEAIVIALRNAPAPDYIEQIGASIRQGARRAPQAFSIKPE